MFAPDPKDLPISGVIVQPLSIPSLVVAPYAALAQHVYRELPGPRSERGILSFANGSPLEMRSEPDSWLVDPVVIDI